MPRQHQLGDVPLSNWNASLLTLDLKKLCGGDVFLDSSDC